MDTLKSKTIASLFWKLLEKGGYQLVQLIVQIVMARLLSPEEFGLLAIILVFVNIGDVLVRSGLNTALVQDPNVDDNDCSTVFWISFAISLALFAVIFIAAPAISEFYDTSELTAPLRAMALLLVINSYNAVQVALAQRLLEFRKLFNATICSVFVSGAFGIASAVCGVGLWALVVQQLTYQLVNCAVLAFQVSWKPKMVFDAKRAKILFGFGWKLLVSGLLDTGYRSLTDLVIGKQFSSSELGLVSQGKKYPAAMGGMLDGAIQPVMMSAVARVQDDIPYVKRLVRRALKTSCYLIMPCMACLALVAGPLVCLLLGEQWVPCVCFMQIYCFTNALKPIHTSNLQALNAMGRSDLFLKLELIKKAIGLSVLLFTAFVLHDIYLMVGSYLFTGIVGTFINARPNKRVIGYSYFEQLKDIAPGIALSLLSMGLAWPISLLGLPDLATIFVQCIMMLCFYVAFSKIFHVEAFQYLVATVKEMLHLK